MSFVPMTHGAVHAVEHQETGIASALLNTAQQIGGALGLAVLSTVSTNAAADRLPEAASALYRGLAVGDSALVRKASGALTHGYTAAFAITAVMFPAAPAVTAAAIDAKRRQHTEGAPAVHLR
ncbi:hypothetical protein OG440_35730 [Streptomyces sp. NBC_00637]|uniref:hypothetical protein n=1 Tax=Streptomyces sp. NBC_00637 TaxID=2903667 RepID=UPI0032538459